MNGSLRPNDSASEIEVAKFLDKNFYNKYTENFRREVSREKQLKGVDATCDYQSEKNLIIDEKAMVQYVNKGLPTFAFEVSTRIGNGDIVDGWLFDQHKLTQYYLLAWIWATKEKSFLDSEITKIELVLIKRSTILEYLSRNGVTKPSTEIISKRIRLNNKFGPFEKQFNTDFYFFYSSQLAEKPINIIVKKSILIKLGTMHRTLE